MLCDTLNLSPKEGKTIIPKLFEYYFGKFDQKKFERFVGDRPRALEIKARSKASGYVLKNCKLYAYAHHEALMKGKEKPNPEDYGVTAADAKLLRQLDLSHINVNTYAAFTLKEFEFVINKICSCPDLKAYIGKLISKKMMFIIKSYGVKRDDITLQLYEAALSVAYRKYPLFENYLHFVNVIKANIHSISQTMIHFYTAQKRQKLMKTNEGAFEAVECSIELMPDVEVETSHVETLREQFQALEHAQNSLNVKPHHRTFLLCLAGHRDESFSAFLGMPNDEAVEIMSYPNYMKRAMVHFEMTPHSTERLFVRLRQEIFGTTL